MTRIEERDGAFYVVLEDGTKRGPFATAELAKAQKMDGAPVGDAGGAAASGNNGGSGLHTPGPLGEKEPRAMRREGIWLFSRPLAFSIDGKPVPVGVWDQLCKVGQFDKDGPVDFSPENLEVALANFARRKNSLAMDYDHQALNASENGQPAPSLARYSCMALVVGGKVVGFDNAKDPSVSPPDPAQLVNPKSGAVDDGLYVYRSAVTPLGQQLLPNYENISPAFAVEAFDEQSNPIGLDFINLAATDIPFLDGMKPIQLSRMGTHSRTASAGAARAFDKGKEMDELKKLADAVDAMRAARKKFDDVDVGGMADDVAAMDDAFKKFDADADSYKKCDGQSDAGKAMAKKMADDVDAMGKRMKKFADLIAAKKMDAADKSDDKGDDAQMKKLAKELGCAASWKEIAKAQQFARRPVEEVNDLKNRLATLEKKQGDEEKQKEEAAIVAFAKKAITAGAWDPEDEAGLIEFRRTSPGAAQKTVDRNQGRFTATQRFTRNSHPGGVDHLGAVDLGAEGDLDSVGGDLVAEANKLMQADPKLTFEKASVIAYSKLGRRDYRSASGTGATRR